MKYPQISDAKRLAKRDNLLRCVVLFEMEDGRVGYSSYGKTRELCGNTREIIDEFFDDIEHRFKWESLRLS